MIIYFKSSVFWYGMHLLNKIKRLLLLYIDSILNFVHDTGLSIKNYIIFPKIIIILLQGNSHVLFVHVNMYTGDHYQSI